MTCSIYRARHLASDRTLLLRVLPARGEVSRARCRAALALAERVAQLPSPHVARTLDVGVLAERWPFVVSDYSRGKTLAAVVAQHGPLGLDGVLPLARQLASVLRLAHAARIRHGDLALSGIWAESPRGRPVWLRTLDFGLCELPSGALDTSRSGVFPSRRPAAGSAFCGEAVRWDIQAFAAALSELALGDAARSPSQLSASEIAERLDATLAGTGRDERARIRGFARLLQRCWGPAADGGYIAMAEVCRDLESLAPLAPAARLPAPTPRPPVTAIHAPARRAQVAIGGPKGDRARRLRRTPWARQGSAAVRGRRTMGGTPQGGRRASAPGEGLE